MPTDMPADYDEFKVDVSTDWATWTLPPDELVVWMADN